MKHFSRYFFLLLFLSTSVIDISAQSMKVESFFINEHDLTARALQPRKDANNRFEAVVKVQLARQDAQFEGNIDTVMVTPGEYWVYMYKDSKRITVKLPDKLPLTVNFKDYGHAKLKEKTTYILRIDQGDRNTGRAYLTLRSRNVKQCDIEISGNGMNEKLKTDGNGEARNINLPYGDYTYVVHAKGYHEKTGRVTLTGEPVIEVFDMESVTGVLKVLTQADATVVIDDTVTMSRQHHASIPTGRHKVTASLNGYTRTEIVNLGSNGMELDMNMLGSLRISSPSGGIVEITPRDGAVKPGLFACETRKEIPSLLGNYSVTVRKKGFESKTLNVEVTPDARINQGFALLRTVDKYFFFNYAGTPHAPIGFMTGVVKHYGWYFKAAASAKAFSLIGSPDETTTGKASLEWQYHKNLGFIDGDVGYDRFDYEGRNAWNITAGGMARLFSWCYPFVGIGYGVDEALYWDNNSLGGKETYTRLFTDRENNGRGMIGELGIMFKWHAVTLIGGYQLHFMKVKTQGELMFGIGLSYNITGDPFNLRK